MSTYAFCNIEESTERMEEAARILFEAFKKLGKDAWPTLDAARQEIGECIAKPNICIGVTADGALGGWIGLRPMYEKTWELHPLAVDPARQGRGLGRSLLAHAEERAQEKGIIGIVLGTDDETEATSLSQGALTAKNALDALLHIRNVKRHPFEFYQKCGYAPVGVIPNANGPNKPDIFMWKNISTLGRNSPDSDFPTSASS